MAFLLLANVLEKFGNNGLKNYWLYPSHYLSTPVLEMTKIELKLIPDPDMYILFEKGTRGGILESQQ